MVYQRGGVTPIYVIYIWEQKSLILDLIATLSVIVQYLAFPPVLW